MSVPAIKHIDSEDYLRQERLSATRNEYHQGRIVAMAGASRNHNRIISNITASLTSQLRNTACNNYASDLRVSIRNGERYLYPDIIVTCGKEAFEDSEQDTLMNPLVIIEVLSPSTESYDRGRKFLYYQTIASLKEYLLISQDSPCFEVYRKQTDGNWLYQAIQQEPLQIQLQAVDCTLDAADVYDKINWTMES